MIIIFFVFMIVSSTISKCFTFFKRIISIRSWQFYRVGLFLFLFFSTSLLLAQQGIGTNAPNTSAALQISASNKGVLLPSVSLTSSSVFAPLTGVSSSTHNGLLVWNNNPTTTNGLSGTGFYFWQNSTTTAGIGNWYRLNSTEDLQLPTGTVTHTSLRWNGSAWVNNQKLLSDGSTTTSITTNLSATGTKTTITGDAISLTGTTTIDGSTTVTGDAISLTGTTTISGDAISLIGPTTLTGNATVTNDLVVAANTTASGTLTSNSTTTLNAALVDGNDNAGTAGQVLSSTGTQTQWTNLGLELVGYAFIDPSRVASPAGEFSYRTPGHKNIDIFHDGNLTVTIERSVGSEIPANWTNSQAKYFVDINMRIIQHADDVPIQPVFTGWTTGNSPNTGQGGYFFLQ